ncbi:MAG: ABC transporter ATP-binding protein [Acidilobus sp.]
MRLPCAKLDSVTYEVEGKRIIDDVTLSLCSGLNLLLGPNGAGKTTMLRLLAGIIRPTRGSVTIDGLRPSSLRNRLTYIPSQLTVDLLTRVVDLGEAMNFNKGDGWRRSLRAYLELLGVAWAEERRLETLSSGEQRLATLAAALSRETDVILADEPTAFLDLGNQAKVFSLLRYLADKNRLVVVATHDVRFVDLADQVIVLKGGRVLYAGPPARIGEDLLSRAYGVRMKLANGWQAQL